MKFRSLNEFETLKFNEAAIQSITFTENQMILEADGVIIKAGNSNNARFEDMYCMTLKLTLNQFKMHDFCEQGFKYFDVDGNLVKEVPDRELSEEETKAVLKTVAGAYLFRMEKCQDKEGYELIFDIESNDEDEFAKTYQMTFDFDGSLAEWDRYSGPVSGIQ